MDDLFNVTHGLAHPWLVMGDFDVILNGEDNIDGLPITYGDIDDFRKFIESCDLAQVPFKVSFLYGGMVELEITISLKDFA